MVNSTVSMIKNVTEIIWGVGAVSKVADILEKNIAKKILVVTDAGIAKSGVLDQVTAQLTGVEYSLFSDVEPNPSVQTVFKALGKCKELEADLIIGVGGGSPIDVAKAVAVVYSNGGSIVDYEGIDTFTTPATPLLAIPTTSGTGSEVTSFTVITDTERNYKLTVGGTLVAARWAIVDPQLTLSLPPGITASTGIDALVHAIESYTSRASFHYSEVLALDAVSLISGSLRKAYYQGDDLQARENMLLGSLTAALAFNNTRLGNAHAISHPLSAFFGIAHGIANGILLPVIMEFNLLSCPDKFARITEAMDPEVKGSMMEKAYASIHLVQRLVKDIKIPNSISELGINKDDYEAAIPIMARDAMKSGNVLVNPRKTNLEDIVNLYHAIY
ncbi:iron-containing alcohol dehydrogenase [Neobacillus sp. MER 74]|uniref:iron-containing alcohol dehydrogenase n=1 Tax=Neobacillus sp. MER 74 TaxID=2939566 RepID=UPI00203E925E|nr:iron-containing alcohol dehydrogenase [Neobacillus sp. MER 74]MCM3113762.1 iron-containing alcohol dehydrogenase [Neobacillus sp. MER 74]